MILKRGVGIVVVILLLALTLFSASVLADDGNVILSNSARITATLLNQDPDPVAPGEVVEVRWLIENAGPAPLEDFEVRVVPEYPFSLRPRDNGVETFGLLQGRQVDEDGAIVEFKLLVDEDAAEGDREVELEYRSGGGAWYKLAEYDIEVRTLDIGIYVSEVKTEPSRFVPGNEGDLMITLTNLADSYMKDVSVKLDLTLDTLDKGSTISDATTYFENLPFAPVASISEKRVESLKPGKSTTLTYRLAAYPTAESRIYKVPVTITYYDELENKFTKNDLIGLVVGAEPDLDVIIDESTIKAEESAGTVTIRFVNKGLSDIKFLNVVLKDQDHYEITSADREYVGNIDSDDFETADFDLYLHNIGGTTSADLPVMITYLDSNNQKYEMEYNLKLNVFPPEIRGEKQSNPLVSVVVVLLIGAAVWYFWRRKKKSKKKK